MNGETVKIKGDGVEVGGYLSHPATPGRLPAVIIIHEVWGLNPHTKDVADRFAAEGYLALAPDLLTGEILDFVDPNILREMADPAKKDEAQKKMRAVLAPVSTPEFAARTMKKLQACFNFLKAQKDANGTVGVVGFCFGGTYSFALASTEPTLRFAISFYGQPPTDEAAAKITCPVLAFYGEKDERLMETLPQLQATMKKYNKNFRSIVYPGVGHAFFNDTNKMMYNADTAAKAWEEVKQFLQGK